MPRLACFACGRTVRATVPLAELFAEERRCPRCGTSLQDDRRAIDRRTFIRRLNRVGKSPTGKERRIGERRRKGRRRPT